MKNKLYTIGDLVVIDNHRPAKITDISGQGTNSFYIRANDEWYPGTSIIKVTKLSHPEYWL